jgi:hypothetical protein
VVVVSSHLLTGLVAVLLGIVIGAVGVFALRASLSPSAGTVANQVNPTPTPSYYGSRAS